MNVYKNISKKDIDGEEWSQYNKSRYWVSTFGRVKSFNKDKRSIPFRILKQQKANGYLWVRLYFENTSEHFYVHRLVAKVFIKPIKGKDYVNHKNGIKTDNRVENLERCTQKENVHHSLENGFQILKGENNPTTRFTNKEVLEIFNSTEPNISIAKRFNVHPSTIRYIKNGRNWSSVTGGITAFQKMF